MKIYYKVVGKGFPLVCLHGNGEDHHIYDEFVSIFQENYQLILIDSRYHGKSIHEGELSYQQMMKDVMSVIDELKLDAYDVIGFSDGGIISLLLGMNDQRLKHMICIGANTTPQSIKEFYRLAMFLNMICMIPFCLYHPKAREKYRLMNLMRKEPHISYQELSHIHIPVLVMAGEFDMIKEKDTLMIGQSLPYSVVKIIKGGNHFLLKDYFKQSVKEIQLFLKLCHKEESV